MFGVYDVLLICNLQRHSIRLSVSSSNGGGGKYKCSMSTLYCNLLFFLTSYLELDKLLRAHKRLLFIYILKILNR